MTSIDRFVEGFRAVLTDAVARLSEDAHQHGIRSAGQRLELDDLEIQSWSQLETTLGWQGANASPVEQQQVVLCISRLTRTAVVYADWRYAYSVRRPDERFWDAVARGQLPVSSPAR